MRIISEKAKVSTVHPGVEAMDAELEVEIYTENHVESVYVCAGALDGRVYTTSAASVFDPSNEDPSFIEEYYSIEDAEKSKYIKYFRIADRMIDEMADF